MCRSETRTPGSPDLFAYDLYMYIYITPRTYLTPVNNRFLQSKHRSLGTLYFFCFGSIQYPCRTP